MGKIQAKSIFRLVPIIGDLGRFLLAFTLKYSFFHLEKKCIIMNKKINSRVAQVMNLGY